MVIFPRATAFRTLHTYLRFPSTFKNSLQNCISITESALTILTLTKLLENLNM